MKCGWKQYFEFSRRERVAVVLLILIILTLWIIPLFFSTSPLKSGDLTIVPLPESFATWGDSSNNKKPESFSTSSSQSGKFNPDNISDPVHETGQQSLSLFYFDPNTADAETWKKLGLKERQVKTILNYISKGGRFRKAEDIQRIYGLSEFEAERLMPFVKIPRVDRPSLKYREEWKGTESSDHKQKIKNERGFRDIKWNGGETYKRHSPHQSIEINTATAEDLEALPGIGKVLSKRILVFRDKLGGFYAVGQVAETYGLTDSTFQKIRPYIHCDSTLVRRIRINDRSDSLIFSHPYFRGRLAQLITTYRSEHGIFQDPESLKKLPMIDGPLYSRIFPYLDLQQVTKNPP